MSETRYYRTVIQVVVLSEDTPFEGDFNLEDVHRAITAGDCSGQFNVTDSQELTPGQAARALIDQHSDPEFFSGLEGVEPDE